MKRGKEEEKVMGPLFPRLHVNDTEKGGPRAPPRNKMALYEQLSIPSQRFKPTLLPINSSSTANAIPPSSSQESTVQRIMLIPHQLPPSRQTTEKTSSHNFDSTAPLVPLEQNKRSEEDDFRVPIFMLSNVLGHDCGKNCNNVDKDRVCPSSRTSAPHPSKHLTKSDDVPRQMEISGSTVRQEARNYHNEELKEFVPSQEQSIKALSNSSSVKNNEVALKLNITSFRVESLDNAVNSCSILQKSDHEQRAACDPKSRTNGDVTMDESSRCKNDGNISISVWSCNSDEQRILDDTEYHEDRTYRSSLAGIAERGDDGSDTSMVDSVSGMEITPDDVVGIIGMRHFWKARRAIVNQQRVFAVQVFELHRLIKVQKLIATSPHLLLEDNSFSAKPMKVSSVKKLPLEHTVKTPTNTAQVKGEKQNQEMECSAENTVGKASPSSVQNGSQMPNYRSFVPTSQVTSMNGDPNMASSWCFPQAQGHHQWLIPVMSPSEGLVYKPYPPGPGYMAAACGGGCGPPVPMPMMGNLYNRTFGVPTSHHYQGAGVPPFTTPSAPHRYFPPPYGMPILNQEAISGSAEQMNHFASSGFHGKSQGVGTDVQNKNPNNPASPKHGGAKANGAASPDLSKAGVCKESEMQVSTASSPSERSRGTGRGAANVEGNNILSLFPTSPAVDISDNDTFLPTRVIKVVPHNGRSATESAARIFQSIQEERKQFDTV